MTRFGITESQSINQRDIAIVGIGVRFPKADTPEQYWDNLTAEVDCIREIPPERRILTDAYMAQKIGSLDDTLYPRAGYLEHIEEFDYSFFKISPTEARLMNPNQRIFLETAWLAIDDAGYNKKMLEGSEVGVYCGFIGDSSYEELIRQASPELLPASITGNCTPVVASRISYHMDLKGPNMVINTSCSSSLVAVHLACQAIRNGECEAAIAGGVQIHPLPYRESVIGVEAPDGRAKPFDDSANGTGIGEGCGAVFLKPLAKAMKDGDTIYAVIKGSAVGQDGASNGIAAPNPDAQAKVLQKAWQNAGINPCELSYIEAHGTGTKLGDPIEIHGINQAFHMYTDKKQFCMVGSVKSNLGHLDGAAGIAGLIKSVLCLIYKKIPPTLHYRVPNRNIDFANSPVYVNDKTRDWITEKKRLCGVSSFGISGTNCHIVLQESPSESIHSKRSGYRFKKEKCWIYDVKKEFASMKLKPTILKSEKENLELNHSVDMTRTVKEIFIEALGYKDFGLHENFFERGGDSISSLSVLNLILGKFQIEITMEEFMEHATIMDVTALIECKIGKEIPKKEIKRAEQKNVYIASSIQNQMYLSSVLRKNNTDYNIMSVYHMKGRLDVKKIQEAFNKLIERHEVLRTSFFLENGLIYQRIHSERKLVINYEENPLFDLKKQIENYQTPFQLHQAPLLRVHLIKVGEDSYYLITNIHHLITDGISNHILIREIIDTYQGLPFGEVKMTYKDFSEWQNQRILDGGFKEHEAYWKKKLEPIKDQLKKNDRINQSGEKRVGKTEYKGLSKSLYEDLLHYCKEKKVTLFMVLLSSFMILQHRLTDKRQIIVGIVLSGRSRPETEHIVGAFVNTLPVVVSISGEESMEQILERVKENTAEVYTHQEYPLEKLVELLGVQGTEYPIFDTAFVYQNYPKAKIALEDLIIEQCDLEDNSSKYNQLINCYETDSLILSLNYPVDCYEKEMIRFSLEGFRFILDKFIHSAHTKVKDISLNQVIEHITSVDTNNNVRHKD